MYAAISIAKFFLLTNIFLKVFQFIKCTMVFWEFRLSGLPNLWQASVLLPWTKTSISTKADITNSSTFYQDNAGSSTMLCQSIMIRLISILQALTLKS